ncbi:MAG TPA: hypothetical protein PLD63_09915, partial [Ignavibacteria bacterium]|nr:hypothetical protein [Ignavibacteria bacterium]
ICLFFSPAEIRFSLRDFYSITNFKLLIVKTKFKKTTIPQRSDFLCGIVLFKCSSPLLSFQRRGRGEVNETALEVRKPKPNKFILVML